MTTETSSVDAAKKYFVGCPCIGVWEPINSPYGIVQLYDVGSPSVVGAWYQDGALQLWPKGWLSGKRLRRPPARSFAEIKSGKLVRRQLRSSKVKLKEPSKGRVPLNQNTTTRKRLKV